MRGVEKLLRGVVRYNDKVKSEAVSRLREIKKKPQLTQVCRL